MLNKSAGYLSARKDDYGRPTVMELLPEKWRQLLSPVGRLDKATTGLLLLTDDGEVAFRCTHPSHHVPKTYRVTVERTPDEYTLRRLRSGVELDDGLTAPAEVWLKEHHRDGAVLEVILHEGRNRQVRRMFKAVSHPVLQLERIAMGPLRLHDLAQGKWRELSEAELTELREACGLATEEDND